MAESDFDSGTLNRMVQNLVGPLYKLLKSFFTSIAAQTAIPSILLPNSTVATNGIITIGTALPTTYANFWGFLPAGAVVGGAAGLYFMKATSPTSAQVYTNYVDASVTAFTPYIPSGALVNAVGSNSAYTQTTASNFTLANVTITGGSMGLNGTLRISSGYGLNSSAGARGNVINLSGSQVGGASVNNVAAEFTNVVIRNRQLLNSQHTIASNLALVYAAPSTTFTAIDTSINQPLTFTGQLATATDYIVLEGFTVEILPA